jgi:hypothetical protein
MKKKKERKKKRNSVASKPALQEIVKIFFREKELI